jgi:Protein of unknown function (DUF3570)
VAVTETQLRTNRLSVATRRGCRRLCVLAGMLVLTPAWSAVLPEDRTDLMYHYYKGNDDVKVRGPAVLVRKSVGDNVSVSGRYYMDMISAASPDVVSGGSPYKDTREEFSLGVDVLHGNSLVSAFLSTSKEDDYLADTFGLNVSHDLFGGLTTVSLGYSQGHDVVERVDTSFQAGIDRYHFRVGLSQVLSKSLLLGLTYEGIAENGYLQNPYRSALILGASSAERYPHTRDSQALAIRLIKGFPAAGRPVGSSLRTEYRYTQDNWGIQSHTLGFAYQHYFGPRWLGEFRSRYYQQSAASFYSDNFTTEMAYMARDKELSTFSSQSLGVKFSWSFLKRERYRMSLNFSHDYIYFDYQDYTNVLTGQAHSFGANVGQLYLSGWY